MATTICRFTRVERWQREMRSTCSRPTIDQEACAYCAGKQGARDLQRVRFSDSHMTDRFTWQAAMKHIE